MIMSKFVVASLVAVLLGASAGCVQYPTERQSVVDLRPQISFRFDVADSRMNTAMVLINGLEAGRLIDFMDGKGSLRVLAGNQVVRVAQ